MTEFISQKMDCIFFSELCNVHWIQPEKNYCALKTHDSYIIRVKLHTWGKGKGMNTVFMYDSSDYLIRVVNIYGHLQSEYALSC